MMGYLSPPIFITLYIRKREHVCFSCIGLDIVTDVNSYAERQLKDHFNANIKTTDEVKNELIKILVYF